MRLLSQLLSLPAPLLLILVTSPCRSSGLEQWPYNLSPHQKYWPEHEDFIKRDLVVQQRLETEVPMGVRKMSEDPSEMFFLSYWTFADDEESAHSEIDKRRSSEPLEKMNSLRANVRRKDSPEGYANASISKSFLPPFLLHADDLSQFRLSRSPGPRSPHGLLESRDFKCPSGTNSCSGIDQPNSCCATNEKCVKIAPQGDLGDVGCCPAGETCGGGLNGCDTAQGYTSCPGSSNGGCCIPNYKCDGIGCIFNDRAQTETVVETFAPAPETAPTIITTTTVLSTIFTTPPGVVTVTGSSTITLPIIPGQTCSPGFYSCAASLSGGCCRTGFACLDGGACAPISTATDVVVTTVLSANAPVRPTSAPSVTVEAGDTTTTVYPSVCPTGYYQCSAYYPGGCCQVGRDCASTNCPATSSRTLLSGSVTVVVPTGAAATIVVGGGGGNPTTTTVTASAVTVQGTQGTVAVQGGAVVTSALATSGTCAINWFNCGATGGGGCCPSGYQCGASCTNTAGVGPAKVNKISPQGDGVSLRLDGWGRWLVGAGVAVGVGMVIL